MSDTQHDKDNERHVLDIDRDEFRAILKLAGYTLTEFAQHIGKSHTFVSELGMYGGHVPSRWIRALISLVTPEAYALHLEKIRKKQGRKLVE